MDKTVEELKKGKTIRGTGDNWDMKIKPSSMRALTQNIDLHLFASNLIVNRLDFTHLPNDQPIGKIEDFSLTKALLNENEWQTYGENSQVLISRILMEFFPKFSIFKDVYPDHIDHDYSKEMKQKSIIATLPVIDADEKKYQDCIKILRTYEYWIWELYHKAGLADAVPEIEVEVALSSNHARPGQPHAEVVHTKDDPMKANKIVFSGDQLTRIRFAGAKDLLKGSHTPTDRLEHCSPFKPVGWHTKASLLQYTYNLLYSAQSVNESGTLKYFREKLNRKNVTPVKVVDSYQGSEELFISMGKGYIVSAALKFFGMSSLDDTPADFPSSDDSDDTIKAYFTSKMDSFVKLYVLKLNPKTPKPQNPKTPFEIFRIEF